MSMSSPKQIADGMLKFFENRKKSNTEVFFQGAVSGFMDIPEDLWALTRDFLDSDNRWRNETDRIRLLTLIKRGVTSEDVRKTITIIIRKYLSGLTQEQSEKLFMKMAGKQLGSIAFKTFFVNELVSLFAARVIPRFLVSAGITGVLSIGASISRAIYTSYELKKINQNIYNELRGAGDLDLLYFFVEDSVQPFIEAMKYQGLNSSIDNEIFNYFLDGVPNA